MISHCIFEILDLEIVLEPAELIPEFARFLRGLSAARGRLGDFLPLAIDRAAAVIG